MSNEELLKRIDELEAAGVLTKEEADAKRQPILDKIAKEKADAEEAERLAREEEEKAQAERQAKAEKTSAYINENVVLEKQTLAQKISNSSKNIGK